MEPTFRPSSMHFEDNYPSYWLFILFAILLGIGLAFEYHSDVKKWFREKFRKYCPRISSCLRICECGSEEANERDPRLPEMPIGRRELQNNVINLLPHGDIGGEHRVYGLPEIMIEMRNLRNHLGNLPNGDVRRNQERSL